VTGGAPPVNRTFDPNRHPVRHLVLGALTLLVTLVAWLAAPPPARAEPLVGQLTLTAVTATEKGVELALEARNTGSSALYGGQIMLWRDETPQTNATDLERVLAADPEIDTGLRLGDPVRSAYHVLGDLETPFEPGGKATFTLSATWEQLSLESDGVYLVGAHLWASPDPRTSGEVVARVRTLVVRPGSTTAQRATFVALTSAPGQLTADVFVDDHLAADFRGRLSDLARAAAQPGVGWYIDPALYAAAQAMAAGYEVQTTEGLVAGLGTDAATAWLALVDALPAASGHRTLWGDPDLALGATVQDPSLITRSQAALDGAIARPTNAEVPGLAAIARLPLLVHLPKGAADDNYLAYVTTTADPDVILAEPPNSAAKEDSDAEVKISPGELESAIPIGPVTGGPQILVPATPKASPPPEVPPDCPLIPTRAVAFPGGPGPDRVDSPLQVAQRAQAEDYLAALADYPNVRVLATLADLQANRAELPEWISTVPVGDLKPALLALPMSTATAPIPTLTEAHQDAARSAAGRFATYAELIDDQAIADALSRAGLAAALSQDWPDPSAAAHYIGALQGQADERLGLVRILLSDHMTLTSHDSTLPVTVANDLPRAVKVRLRFASTSPLRLTAAYDQLIEIQPGDRLGVTLTPLVRANGTIGLAASLTTDSGQPLGTEVTSEVVITESGRLAWAIVAVSGLVLAIGTVLRVRTVQKSRRLAAAEAGRGDTSDD
jgi:hypothetical protein